MPQTLPADRVPALSLLGLVLGLSAYRALQNSPGGASRAERGRNFAVIMAICWGLLHSLTDFSLQIPAVAVTFAAILALAHVNIAEKESKN